MTKQPPSGNGKALSAPLIGSANISRADLILQAAELIFSAYRPDNFANPDLYLLQVGMKLECYPDDVIRELASPRYGIQTKSKNPPTLFDITEACEEILDHRPEAKKPLAIEPPIDPVMQARVGNLLRELSTKLRADSAEARGLTIKAMAEEKNLPLDERLQRQRKRQMA